MSRTLTRVVESRPYDSRYDVTYTGPQSIPPSHGAEASNAAFVSPLHQMSMDPRVAATVSSSGQVAGRERFKYFRRPIMPRISAIPPQVLLAPTSFADPLVAVIEDAEPPTKSVEVQTV